MSELTLRPAECSDALEIARVQYESARAATREAGQAAVTWRDESTRQAIWQQRIANHPCQTLVATEGGAITGLVFWQLLRPGYALLKSLYVHPYFWHRKIGHRLYRQALTDMRLEGVHRVELWVNAGNRRAERFYLREGLRYDQQTKVLSGQLRQRHMYGPI